MTLKRDTDSSQTWKQPSVYTRLERAHVWWSHEGFRFMAVLSSIHVNWMKDVVITVKRIEAIVLYGK